MKNFMEENWFKIIFAISILIVAISIGYYFVIYNPNYQDKKLIEQRNEQTGNDILVNQEKCANQALYFYKQAVSGGANSYTNHWNKSLGKCFIEIIDINAYSKDLNDAIGGNSYGTFFHSLDNKYGFPDTCEMKKDSTDSSYQRCKSETEFDNFVKPYMEN